MNLHQLNRVLLQTLLLPVVAISVLAGALAWQLLDAERAVRSMQIADANIATATFVTALVDDEATGVRSFQLTGNEIFLQPYEFARDPLRVSLGKLHDGLTAQGVDLESLNAFRKAHTEWVNSFAEPTIATVEADGDTRDPGLNLRAKAQTDQMRSLIAEIVRVQHQRRTDAVEHWESELRHTVEALLFSALLLGLLIGIFARNRLHMVTGAFQGTLAALRRHAQATYDSEQQLRAILVSLSEAVVVCDLKDRIELMNASAEQLSGWTQGEAAGQPFERVFPMNTGDGHPMEESPVEAVRRHGRSFTAPEPLQMLRRDGTEISIDPSGAPVQERNGDLAAVALVLRDVTQQRRTQAALLASEKLATAGRLAATIAHEIHNPLDSVANLLYLMKTGESAEENEQFLDTARAELDRATQISRSLLGMYRESRTPVAVDISELLSSVLLLIQHRYTQGGIGVDTDLLSPAIVSGYPVELRQVFTNLLANAADASSPGSRVMIRTKATLGASLDSTTSEKRPGILITIEDQGAGVRESVRERLFQPFFTTKGEAGTGLGLWVSRGIIQKHEGSITLTSNTSSEKHGTCVAVFLPRGSAPFSGESSEEAAPKVVLPEQVRTAEDREAVSLPGSSA